MFLQIAPKEGSIDFTQHSVAVFGYNCFIQILSAEKFRTAFPRH